MSKNGFNRLSYLLAFKEWLMELRQNKRLRLKNKITGLSGQGAFNLETRELIYKELIKTACRYGDKLLLPSESRIIKKIWRIGSV